MDIYQFAKVDGSPDWTPGNEDFDKTWERAFDLLRFHRGKKFTIQDRREPHAGPERTLGEVSKYLKPQITSSPAEVVFEVKSLQDQYAIVFRRHQTPLSKGELVIAHAKELIGTPYIFGVNDCSWLTMHCYGQEGVDLPHNAHLQHIDSQVVSITRSEIKTGDLLFHHNDDHVSLYLDGLSYGRVIDTEPHDTVAPWGGNLGTGVRVRPMNPNYYCDWADVNGIGRVREING